MTKGLTANAAYRQFLSNFVNFCQDLSKFVNSNHYIALKNNFFVPIMDKCDCNSSNIVYIIRCLKCEEFYIGQSSKSVKIRIGQHIRAIKNFKPFLNYTNEVGYHFNLSGHN